jgi:hypothetical protein
MNRKISHCDLVRNSQINARQRRRGPEKDLVDWFLSACPLSKSFGLRVSVFEEPRLQSGFPDVVFVIWDQEITTEWTLDRRLLTAHDLRLLHCLSGLGSASETDLEKLFLQPLNNHLRRLESADVAVCEKGLWSSRPLQQIYAVKEIIAVEAKIGSISQGLDQSALNRWFASSSYLLLPHIPGEDMRSRAAELNVGILTQKSGILSAPLKADSRPQSYASWQFNEWVWKASIEA